MLKVQLWIINYIFVSKSKTNIMTTSEMNNKLQILQLNKFSFKCEIGTYRLSGHALFIEGLGFLKFKNNKHIYTPRGGKKALQEIISFGGMTDYDNIEFIKNIVI